MTRGESPNRPIPTPLPNGVLRRRTAADEVSAPATDHASGGDGGGGMSDLFGRSLLYVVVWSLQILSASLVSPILAHVMGPAEFGLLATAIAVHQVLMVLATIGLDQAVSLEYVQSRSDREARGLVAASFVLSSGVMAVAGATAPWWGGWLGFGGTTSLVIATVLWTAPAGTVLVMLALLRGADRLGPFVLLSVLSAVGGQVLGITLLFTSSRDAGTYAWGGVLSQYAALLLGVALVRPRIGGLIAREPLTRAMALGLSLAVSGLSTFVLTAGDRVIIQTMLGAEEVGRYQVAYTVGNVVVLLLMFTSNSWTPRIAAVEDVAQRWRLIGRSRDELYRLMVPVLLGVTLAAPVALRIVAPASFRPESLVLVVVLVAMAGFPAVAAGASHRALVSVRRSRPLAVAGIAAAVASISLNLALVPVLGIAGSAAATVLAYSVQAGLQRRAVPPLAPWPKVPATLVLAAALAVTVAVLSTLPPDTSAWNAARFAAGLACLPWFLVRLRAARRALPRGRRRRDGIASVASLESAARHARPVGEGAPQTLAPGIRHVDTADALIGTCPCAACYFELGPTRRPS